MIQEIAPAVFRGEFRVKAPGNAAQIFCFWEKEVLLTQDGAVPTLGQLPGVILRTTYLFSISEEEYYLGDLLEKVALPGLVWRDRKVLRSLTPMAQTLAGFTAWHLAHWYRENRFCGRCGGEMVPDTQERKMVCTACGHRVYPRINPSVIIAVHDKERLLMSRYANRPIRWYVLLAGFIEVGETAEQCVQREVWEETRLRVKNIRYYGSQPWGITGGLSLGYTAELDGSDELHVDPNELSEARWFSRAEVPVREEDHASITQDMVRAFARGVF